MVVLKCIVRALSEGMSIADQDFENFVGISKVDWVDYELSDKSFPVEALSNFCMLMNLTVAKLFQMESYIRRELSLSRGVVASSLTACEINSVYWHCKHRIEEDTFIVTKKPIEAKYTADYKGIISQLRDEDDVDYNIPAYIRKYQTSKKI